MTAGFFGVYTETPAVTDRRYSSLWVVLSLIEERTSVSAGPKARKSLSTQTRPFGTFHAITSPVITRAEVSKQDEVTLDVGKHLRRYAILCLWLVAGVVYTHMVVQWIGIKSNDKEFVRSVQHSVQLVGTENRPTKDLRALLLVRAESFSIPIHGDDILINGKEDTLSVSLHYDAYITLPVLNKSVYKMSFNHQVGFRLPNS